MHVSVALLASLALHLALILGPELLASPPSPPPQARIEVRLPPQLDQATEAAEDLSTEPASTAPVATRPNTPEELRGDVLRRAQTELTRHLYYPPAAVERGLEGEVMLLLILDEAGRVTRVDVARSSGHAILDQAAVEASTRIGRLPGAKRQTLFPIRFRLN